MEPIPRRRRRRPALPGRDPPGDVGATGLQGPRAVAERVHRRRVEDHVVGRLGVERVGLLAVDDFIGSEGLDALDIPGAADGRDLSAEALAVTPSPRASTVPATSLPSTSGEVFACRNRPTKSPSMIFASPALTAEAITLTRTSPDPGVGIGSSASSTPSPVAPIARIVSATAGERISARVPWPGFRAGRWLTSSRPGACVPDGRRGARI